MASILPGYEYDIFISYRQKDNKGDKWVSEFVEALKRELDATFKEDISIYYDENPHDGLLETHDVDASLKEKLRCLIFIPIVSRTYCDPKSFAWEHEFKPFVELSSNDQFGLKIKLPNGNVASRVLPVRIHELEPEDHRLCESVIGGVLRGVDFIYKSTGVNRPLRINEDYPQNNLNKTYYRDQINKVANALDEIFHALKNPGLDTELLKEHASDSINVSEPAKHKTELFSVFRKKSFRRTVLFLAFILCAAGAIVIFNFLDAADIKKSLAILPFRCADNDPSMIARGDMVADLTLSKLQKVKSLTTRPGISSFRYRNTDKTLRKIRKELDANYIVDGTVRSDTDRTIILVSLVDARHEKQLWSSEYLWENNQISSIVSDISRGIASSCGVELTVEELKQIDSSPTKSSKAYLNFLSANVTYNEVWNLFNAGNSLLDAKEVFKAVADYDRAIKFDSLFASAYARRAITISWGCYVGVLDTLLYMSKCREDISKALELDPDLYDGQLARGFYYYFIEKNYESALVYFNRASLVDPGNYQPHFYMGMVYRKMGDWGRSQNHLFRVIQQNPQVPLFLTNIGMSYNYMHKFDSAVIFHKRAIGINPKWRAAYNNEILSVLLLFGRTKEARQIAKEAEKMTGQKLTESKIRFELYDGNNDVALRIASNAGKSEFKNEFERQIIFGDIYRQLNKHEKSIAYYDSALAVIADLGKNNEVLAKSAIAYACTGKREMAISTAKLALKLSENDKMEQSNMKLNEARVLALTGDYENSLMILEYLLENPSQFSIKLLMLDPDWKPLLKTERGKELIAKYSN